MNLSQAKIDLAVLYKLHQSAEHGGGPITPEDVQAEFQCDVPLRRDELGLQTLATKLDVEREDHPYHLKEGLSQISRAGLERVDRALRVSSSFIGRLHANGDGWIESDEANIAVLKNLAPHSRVVNPETHRVESMNAPALISPISIHVSPHFTNTQSSASDDSATKAGWWSVWGTWIGAAIGLSALLWGLHVAKVI